jgi:tripartite-type tricarboxylate transporter receptor subunit TctC
MFDRIRSIITAALLCAAIGVQAQPDYPSRPITLVVPVNPGGITDQIARAFAAGLSQELKQSVVVENKGGAGGTLGAATVARAAPDGHTACFCYSGPVTLAKVSMASLPYDIDRAFAPVTRVYDLSPIVAVPVDSPHRTLAELLQAATMKPGMTFGHTGVGGALHLGFEALRQQAKVDMTAVSYPGENPMIPDLVTGRLDSGLLSPLFAKTQADAGKIRLLVSMGTPSPLPGVAPLSEVGYPNIRGTTWSGFFLPSGTPAPVVQKFYTAIQVVAASEDIRKRLSLAGLTPVIGQTPEQFRAFVELEKQGWADVVKRLGGLKN